MFVFSNKSNFTANCNKLKHIKVWYILKEIVNSIHFWFSTLPINFFSLLSHWSHAILRTPALCRTHWDCFPTNLLPLFVVCCCCQSCWLLLMLLLLHMLKSQPLKSKLSKLHASLWFNNIKMQKNSCHA